MSNNYLLSQLLNCGDLDVNFLQRLIDEFDIWLDVDSIRQEFWHTHINLLIYEAFREIKDRFVRDYKDSIEAITEKSIDDFEECNIFTNCIDSHLWFNDEKIESLYEDWKEEHSFKTS
jgi:hypothetical protein